ncbi:hypothetical protein [Novosphingobium sp. FSW06-99]|uniref:hypothetical protein n=1 Tax=Novosphingobium sp. FSW06-99 TaxID=1739113 RepID=UPI00076C4A69|nr:hypothetical protein [Novosphingobium sp. FSW06-99]KUR74686.1 hypothetical protein AQZ49_17485 [Novosphingobium sp. FSW06-99]
MAALIPLPAYAGPPFVTDDPEPTDPGHWEIYNYAGGTLQPGNNATQFGWDINYGPVKDVQLTTTLPLATQTGQPFGLGDAEFAIKVKVLHHDDGVIPLDISVFPRVIVPTAHGSTQTQVLLPVWAEHDWDGWSVFGGGGYTLNPGAGNRDYWQQGVVVTHMVRAGFMLGLEYYGQSRDSLTERAVTGVNLGTQIHLAGPFSLLGAFGQGLNRKQTVFYTSLKLDL